MNHAQISLHTNLEYGNHSLHLQPDFQKHNDFIQQKESDKNFIKHFVQGIQRTKPTNNCIKISEAKTLLLDIIRAKKELEKQDLDVTDENFDSNYEELKNRLNEINSLINIFNDNITTINQKLKKRIKKRERIKKKKEKYKILKEETQKQIKKKHKIIDEVLNERLKGVNAVKREEALKRQADSVLLEVRKKRNEGKKMLNMLIALKKLRELRSKQEEERGGYCSKQVLETFNKVINRFQKLWERQMEVYQLEEKGLRIMLEENTIPIVQNSEFEINLLHWEKILFGEDETVDKDISALIQVRQDWDKFITKEPTAMASSIPLGWVIPPSTENEEWKMFQQKKKF